MFKTVITNIEEPSLSDPDLSIVQACLQGDPHGFKKLYQRHQQKVRSTLYQLCGTDGLDDLVQDVFLRAWKGLPKFRQSSQFSTWLYRIAFNVASDRRKALAKMRSRNINVEDEQLANFADEAIARDGDSQPNLTQMHYQDLMQRGLAKLSEDHRTVLVLHDLEELPQKDIAEILSIPVGTVKSRLFHARSAIKKFLEAQGVEL
ncbi:MULTISPECIES: sigma-70 family RNA polymerase sigma factor [Pseudanabaena]|uniref:RNA polymerase, sigma subunit, ECF family n=2 Tax=Pseudanabaena TaxID=1152 RepID=L8MX46_9CYAN|nr:MULTISPECIES: sigma-70 family RNA polymerase sigma factor [Pseudanabaena]ELS31364.1 RNA polymerase, sigma subunit, ECF family [Pseudanabaena biceps PCC 7429]MDG3496373.1 sigma-70 family RNA polymerase sigma factor [Pseudanabaena catenata USMAC16]TYQ30701.1 sigma-70 family RNA polymerase sigma factor [Pseudanabaena sp. UWO310]